MPYESQYEQAVEEVAYDIYSQFIKDLSVQPRHLQVTMVVAVLEAVMAFYNDTDPDTLKILTDAIHESIENIGKGGD